MTSDRLGFVTKTSARNITVRIDPDEQVKHARVGQMITVESPTGGFLIGVIDSIASGSEAMATPELSDSIMLEAEENVAKVTLVGHVGEEGTRFNPSFVDAPAINANCIMVAGDNLADLLALMSEGVQIGHYTRYPDFPAHLNADNLLQRHLAILGSTGAGKSWLVARILEEASKLHAANIIVFDLHGEYGSIPNARQLKIPGPNDKLNSDDNMLFLPYWLLDALELQSMFIDQTEHSAHNQVSKFNSLISKAKGEGRTLDAPIPFSIRSVMDDLIDANEERVQGDRGKKQGPHFGHFTRLIARMEAKVKDDRLAFLFSDLSALYDNDPLCRILNKLTDHTMAPIRIIDFSEVPKDILPVIIGLVARLVYDANFWTSASKRHPLAMICDEAHIYLSKRSDKNPLEKRAAAMFDRVAKEGRKYGVSLVVVSQRPSELSSTIISQCNNLVALRMSNRDDLSVVSARVPEGLDSILEALPVLNVGEAVVLGDGVSLPDRITITPPTTPPNSATVDVWSQWSEAGKDVDIHQIAANMERRSK